MFSRFERGYLATNMLFDGMELVEQSVSVLRCGENTKKFMLLVGLPVVCLINK